MHLRPLTPLDAPAWWRLRLEALEREPGAFGSSPEEHRATTITDAGNRIRNFAPDCFILGVFDGEVLIANATLIRESNLKELHKAHLYGVYVSAAHRGLGAGRDLLHGIIDIARSIGGLEQLHLSVSTSNETASRLYRKLGFVPYGTEPHALKVGAAYIDEDHMVLRLR